MASSETLIDGTLVFVNPASTLPDSTGVWIRSESLMEIFLAHESQAVIIFPSIVTFENNTWAFSSMMMFTPSMTVSYASSIPSPLTVMFIGYWLVTLDLWN